MSFHRAPAEPLTTISEHGAYVISCCVDPAARIKKYQLHECGECGVPFTIWPIFHIFPPIHRSHTNESPTSSVHKKKDREVTKPVDFAINQQQELVTLVLGCEYYYCRLLYLLTCDFPLAIHISYRHTSDSPFQSPPLEWTMRKQLVRCCDHCSLLRNKLHHGVLHWSVHSPPGFRRAIAHGTLARSTRNVALL